MHKCASYDIVFYIYKNLVLLRMYHIYIICIIRVYIYNIYCKNTKEFLLSKFYKSYTHKVRARKNIYNIPYHTASLLYSLCPHQIRSYVLLLMCNTLSLPLSFLLLRFFFCLNIFIHQCNKFIDCLFCTTMPNIHTIAICPLCKYTYDRNTCMIIVYWF